jgi:hypothetical protein
LSAPRIAWSGSTPGTFLDGIAVDENGGLYVANYTGGTILKLPDAVEVARTTNPASLAFRGTTLLFTDYRLTDPSAEGGLHAIDLGICGARTP